MKLKYLLVVSTLLAACSGENPSGAVPENTTSSSTDVTVSSSSANEFVVSSSSEVVKSSSSTPEEQNISSTNVSSSSVGTSYPSNYNASTQTLTDERDGKIYKTVTIGSQIWLAENLAYDLKDADGYEAFYCPNDDASNCAIYGNVYDQRAFLDEYDEGVNYPAVPESQRPFKGICPTGWHVPSIEEWQVLLDNAYVQDLVAESAGGTGKSGFDVLLAGGLSLNGSLYYEKAGLFASVDDYDIRNMASVKISATSASALKVICNYFVSVRCLMN